MQRMHSRAPYLLYPLHGADRILDAETRAVAVLWFNMPDFSVARSRSTIEGPARFFEMTGLRSRSTIEGPARFFEMTGLRSRSTIEGPARFFEMTGGRVSVQGERPNQLALSVISNASMYRQVASCRASSERINPALSVGGLSI
jgi:hypothetical protein